MIEQAAILCGGAGTRLGALTRDTPKPLLAVAGRPFLAFLIDALAAQGVRRVLLLASYHAAQVRAFAASLRDRPGPPVEIDVAIEPERAGTGGALWHARAALDATFFLLNGDSWLEVDLPRLSAALAAAPDALGVLSLRHMPSGRRYGAVELAGDRITTFAAAPTGDGAALINGGIYALRRELAGACLDRCSLEEQVLPSLATQRRLRGLVVEGRFIDIGVPEDFARAQRELPLMRPAPLAAA